MAAVPKIDVRDKFAQDLEKLTLEAPNKAIPKSDVVIPSFQHQGFMEKLGHQRRKWFKRYFVLRDSFLLSYNLEKSELTVEPRSCIHLAGCKVQEMQHGEKACFFITTAEKDQFLFALPTEEERKSWMKDIQIARTITHANMVKLAVENQFIAEEKKISDVTKEKSTSSLAIFSNKQYIKKTPLIGGAEGWLFTPGFNASYHKGGGLFSSKVKWAKHYFILRDSHLLMFRGGDILTKPRGCMYLVGTQTEPVDQTEDKSLFVFVCRSVECGDVVELATHSEKYRKRWINALRIGARVTYRDFKLLLKEHELLVSYKPPEEEGNASAAVMVMPPPIFEDDTDVQGKQLDPGVMQAYNKDGMPILRNPDGKLVDPATGDVVKPTDPRFAESGEQLDPFNRPLPEGAVPMFTADMVPIGVGPDGKHYLPDGTEVATTDPHFDMDGQQLDQSAVDAAGAIAGTLNVAIKVRAHLKGDGATTEAVDVLGRTFRDLNEDHKGMVENADGEKVPIATARVMDSEDTKQLVDFKTYREKEQKTHRDLGTVPLAEKTGKLRIMMEDEESTTETEVGVVDVDQGATLRDVRELIAEMVDQDFVFLVEDLPLMKFEEHHKLAVAVGDTITIRPRKEIKTIAPKAPATGVAKIKSLHEYELQKQREAEEFKNILSQIKSGTYLKPVGKDDIPLP